MKDIKSLLAHSNNKILFKALTAFIIFFSVCMVCQSTLIADEEETSSYDTQLSAEIKDLQLLRETLEAEILELKTSKEELEGQLSVLRSEKTAAEEAAKTANKVKSEAENEAEKAKQRRAEAINDLNFGISEEFFETEIQGLSEKLDVINKAIKAREKQEELYYFKRFYPIVFAFSFILLLVITMLLCMLIHYNTPNRFDILENHINDLSKKVIGSKNESNSAQVETGRPTIFEKSFDRERTNNAELIKEKNKLIEENGKLRTENSTLIEENNKLSTENNTLNKKLDAVFRVSATKATPSVVNTDTELKLNKMIEDANMFFKSQGKESNRLILDESLVRSKNSFKLVNEKAVFGPACLAGFNLISQDDGEVIRYIAPDNYSYDITQENLDSLKAFFETPNDTTSFNSSFYIGNSYNKITVTSISKFAKAHIQESGNFTLLESGVISITVS